VSAETQRWRSDRPEVLDRLRGPDGERRHAVLEASAGTGKTHAIEHLVLDLLSEATPIEQILVVTFTEKATLEMRSRIRARIASGVAAGQAHLRRALTDFDRAPISTIHAFCQRVLMEHAFASGRLLEEQRQDAREAFGRAFRDALRRGLADGAAEKPLLEVALRQESSAVLEESLFRFSRQPGELRPAYDPARVLAALAAMPASADEARAVAASVPQVVRPRTRDALALLVPLAARARAGSPERELLGPLVSWAMRAPHGRAETDASYLAIHLGADARLGAHVRTLDEACRTPLVPLVHRFLPALLARLDEEKRLLGRYDFDDMLRSVDEALRSERGPELVAALRARYRHALIDEFQDTDAVQWSIFRRLFFEERQGSAGLFLIGDPKQSIYAFRSADVHTYLAACAELEAAGGARAPLVDCYRSTPALLAGVNRILEAGFFTGKNRYPHPVRPGRPELTAVGPDGEPVAPIVVTQLVGKDDLRAKPLRASLAAAIAVEIERLLAGGLRVSRREAPGELRPIEPSDVFVLCRTGKEALEVADALRARGIAHALSTPEPVFRTRAARDVLDVLRALEEPGSRARRLRAWTTPFFGAGPEELDALCSLPAEHAFFERLGRWAALAAEHRYAQLFAAMVGESGLGRRLLFLHEGERDLVNVEHVLELLLERAGRGRLGLRELTAELDALVEGRALSGTDEDVQRLESERAAVQLLTMHKSKGLEAEVVFLFGGMTARRPGPLDAHVFHEADGRRVTWLGKPPPELEPLTAAEEREEEERLLYVAMTRARSRLYLPLVGQAPPPPPGMVSRFPRLSGCYRWLNDRLGQLASTGGLEGMEIRTLVVSGSPRRIAVPPPLGPVPSPAPAAEPEVPAPSFARLRALARGAETTSYSRMKAGRRAEEEEWEEEPAREAPASDDGLPGGAAFGTYVHELLETLDWARVREVPDAAALLSEARALFEKAADPHGIEADALEGTARLVFTALRTPIRAPGLALPGGLASLPRVLREMPFLHPIPELGQPALGRAGAHAVDRGFVRGIVDLLFEHEGRTWVLDWKTDRLGSYEGSSVAAHSEEHYDVQAKLYALAAARMLRIEDEARHQARFGGLVYAYVRGMADGERTQGLHVSRPSFAALRAWDDEMRRAEAPWGHPLPAPRAKEDR